MASSVLPVPGGPTRSTPLGIRPPSFANRSGAGGLEDRLQDVVGVLAVGHGDVERHAAVDADGPPELLEQLRV